VLISLLHPSRSRPDKSFQTYSEWIALSSGEIKIEHIPSLDKSDPKLHEYKFKNSIINNNTCVVEAANCAAKESKGDIILYLSDDFKCPQNWDKLIVEKFDDMTMPMLLRVDDCLQRMEADVVTIPIINRELYKKLGYFFNPDFKSMFVDQHLYHVCKNNHWVRSAAELKFPHEHYCNGKATKDETYTRSEAHWDSGKAMYQKYKNAGFPIRL